VPRFWEEIGMMGVEFRAFYRFDTSHVYYRLVATTGYNHMVNLGDRELREVTTTLQIENITFWQFRREFQNIISIQNVDGKIRS